MAVEFHYSGVRRIKRRYHQKFRQKLISVINVTPFVDVMLVLLIIFILVIVILARGIIQQNLVELTILTIGVFYLFTDKIRFNILDKPTRLLYLLCFIVFTISLHTTNNFNSFNIVYNFFLLLVFLSIFNSYNRAEFFVICCGCIISIICFIQILHLFEFIDVTNFNLFYLREGFVRSQALMGNPNYSAYNSFVCFILFYFSRIKYKRIFLFFLNFENFS